MLAMIQIPAKEFKYIIPPPANLSIYTLIVNNQCDPRPPKENTRWLRFKWGMCCQSILGTSLLVYCTPSEDRFHG